MTIHFHFLRTAFVLTLAKQDSERLELAEKTDTLTWYALTFAQSGARARYVLRRWAGGAR